MMGVEGGDRFAHEVLQRLRREDGHAGPPGHQVMDDLEKAAGAEAHDQRTVRLVARGLRRMEEKGAGVRRGGGGKRSTTSCGSSWNTPNERSA